MKQTVAAMRMPVLVVVMLALTASATWAQPPSVEAVIDFQLDRIRATRHVERVPRAMLGLRSQQAPPPKRSWIRRHPVLVGAIVGSVAGASIVGAAVDREASPVGFYAGGAVGALVGWVGRR